MDNRKNSPIFVVTVDTESDDAWLNPGTIKLNNIKEIPRFQELCEKYNIIPTYLITYEYAAREESISVLKPILDRKKCEIGHHLHSWSTPPFQKPNISNEVDLEWIHAYQFELPDNLFEEKAMALKEVIKQNYGIDPTSHRAGRWGIDQRTIDWLIKNKFVVDSSIVPNGNYSKHKGKYQGGKIFNDKPLFPYIWNGTKKGNLIEIPVSVYYPFKFFNHKFFRGEKIGKKIGNRFRIGRSLTLNPAFGENFNKLFIKNEIRKNRPVINLVLHSSELAMNCSPYTNTITNYKKVWNILENSFKVIYNNNINSLTLTETAKIKI